ncbi:MAG TPA: tRNA (adenosine(37)-N6)-threonylcarbamoyltransferase complex dimerization subunit type 1 TsaB [Terriglobia bacterium]|nr:tRNA (adenosine(37)-N6)-threonylcarbamoyltransferase complex dimerization subunit type 1 TsaB [Terriglobia bacterium]
MLILAFDTTSDRGGAALYRGHECLASAAGDRNYSVTLFTAVDGLLERAGLRLRDVDLLAVANGPGSFTGIRVGLAAAQGWAKALDRPARGISVLAALAEEAQPRASVAVSILDARRGEFYVGAFRREESSASFAPAAAGGLLMKPAALGEYVEELARPGGPGGSVTCLGRSEEPVEPARAALPASCEWQTVSGTLVHAIARLALKAQASAKPFEAAELDAYYIRRSDAEMHWTEQN